MKNWEIWEKWLLFGVIGAFLSPIFWSLGDAIHEQAGIHWFDSCLYTWSLLLAAGGLVGIFGGFVQWMDE